MIRRKATYLKSIQQILRHRIQNRIALMHEPCRSVSLRRSTNKDPLSLKYFSTNLIERIMHASHVYIRYKTEYMEAGDYLLALEFSIKNIGISVANLISGSRELSRRSRS
jgi:hypothetical protein